LVDHFTDVSRQDRLRHKFAPIRDPQRFPVCPRCKELAGLLGIGG
jgi:Protein of unknown function (DUF3039)